ncbi:MAG: NAD(P)H-dependent oxidoreductase [Azoarcus sp.]|nr:NAD(P)H-dependent oxidoreductase [Azoarcus sp.]
MPSPRLLALCGSARRDSYNRRALAVAMTGAREAGAELTFIEPREFVMPLYDGDLEASEGLPEAAARLQQLFAEHDGVLVATPEYNGFFTPLLKNTLDWVSRPLPDGSNRPGTIHLRGKAAGLVTASPGALGGIRALQHARLYLANLGLVVVPEQAAVPAADKVLGADGSVADDRTRSMLEGVGSAVCKLATALAKRAD